VHVTLVYARLKFGSGTCGDYREIVKYSKVLAQSPPDKHSTSIKTKNNTSNTNREFRAIVKSNI